MGSFARLEVANVTIEWSTNALNNNRSCLLLADDLKELPSDDGEFKEWGYCRALGDMVKRLELLGYTRKDCEYIYDEMADSFEFRSTRVLPFTVFASALSVIEFTECS